MHKYFNQQPNSPTLKEIQRLQSLFFITENFLFIFYLILSSAFSAILCLCPILTNSGLTPYRAKFPFALKSYSETPYLFTSVYIFQSATTFFILLSIVLIDNLGCNIFTQTTLNLKIFCIRIRAMGSLHSENCLEQLHKTIIIHQYLIRYDASLNSFFFFYF